MEKKLNKLPYNDDDTAEFPAVKPVDTTKRRNENQKCLAQACADAEFKRTGKYPTSIMISCPCPKCVRHTL